MKRYFIPITLLLILLLAGLTAFTYNTVVPARGLRFDFYPHWVGGRTVWNGQTPYTPETTRQIQMGMFNAELPPDADQQNFAYPAYTSIALAPVIALPASLSVALWMSIGLLSVMVSPLIWLAILGWRPKPLLVALLILGLTFAFHYPMDAYILGQFSPIILLGISLGILLFTLGKDTAAGIAFALATIPPTVGAPIALLILGIYVLRGRWRGLAAFIVTVGALVLISILRIGWWIPDWLNVVRAYASYAPPVWPPNFLPLIIRIPFVIGLLGITAVSFQRSVFRSQQNASLLTWYSVAIIAVLILIPQTGYYYLVLLIPVIVMLLQQAEKLPRTWRWGVYLAIIAAVLSPWLYFALPGFDVDAQSLILPVHVGLIALFIAYKTRSATAP